MAHMEVFHKDGVTKAKAKDGWSWHRIVNGKVTAGNGGFDSRGNAIRAAKGDVRAVCSTIYSDGLPYPKRATPTFTMTEKDGVTRIEWS